MFSITTDTLENFRRLKSETMRAAAFLSSSDTPITDDALMTLQQGASALDVFDAFQKDMSKSVKFITAVAKVLGKTDVDSGRCQELDGGEIDLREVFPINGAGQLKMFGMTLTLGRGFYEDIKPPEVREAIYQNAMQGRSYAEFVKYYKLLKLEGQNDLNPEVTPFYVRLEESARIQSMDKVKVIAMDMLKLAEKTFELRESLDGETKRKMNDVVYGGRALIDGTTLASTYLTKNIDEQNDQRISPSHRKDSGIMKDIKKLFDDMPYLSAIEIDPDTDIAKFKELLVSLKEMKLSNIEPFELKSRKLGNYGASGLFAVRDISGVLKINEEYGFSSSKLRIVAVDVRSPTSLAHELAHFADTPDAPNINIRDRMVRHFLSKLPLGPIAKAFGNRHAEYLANDREVIARLGEIGYMLNQVDFTKNDSPQKIYSRVREWEKNRVDEKFKTLLTGYIKENALPVSATANVDEMRAVIVVHQTAQREILEAESITRKAKGAGISIDRAPIKDMRISFNDEVVGALSLIENALPDGVNIKALESTLYDFYRSYDVDKDKTLRGIQKLAKEQGVDKNYTEVKHVTETAFKQNMSINEWLPNNEGMIKALGLLVSGITDIKGYAAFRHDVLIKEMTISKLSVNDFDFVDFIKPLLSKYLGQSTLLNEPWFIDKTNKIKAAGGQVTDEFILRQITESFFTYVANEASEQQREIIYTAIKGGDTFNVFLSQAIQGGFSDIGIKGFAEHHDMTDFTQKSKETVLLGNDVNYYVKISKDLSKYLTDVAYFDMAGWDTEELCLVRDYAHGFYYTPPLELSNKLEKDMNVVNHKVVTSKQLHDPKRFRYNTSITETDKRRKSWHSLPTEPQKMGELIEIGMDKGIFLPGEFGFYFAADSDVLYKNTPKGKLNILGLDGQMTAIKSVLESCEKVGLNADLIGLRSIAESYPRLIGNKRSDLNNRSRVLKVLNVAEPNESLRLAESHRGTEYPIMYKIRNRKESWVETIKDIKSSADNAPTNLPSNTFAPIKAIAFADFIVRGVAPEVSVQDFINPLYELHQKQSIHRFAFDEVGHSNFTQRFCNIHALEVEIVKARVLVNKETKKLLVELDVPLVTNISELPVVKVINSMSEYCSDIRIIEDLLSYNMDNILYKSHNVDQHVNKKITASDSNFPNPIAMLSSVLIQLGEQGDIPLGRDVLFMGKMKEILLSSDVLNNFIWSSMENAAYNCRANTGGPSTGVMMKNSTPLIATLITTRMDNAAPLNENVKQLLVSDLFDEISARIKIDSTQGAFTYISNPTIDLPPLSVGVGQSIYENSISGTKGIDEYLKNISINLIRSKGKNDEIVIPKNISPDPIELENFFVDASKNYSKEMVDVLMTMAQEYQYQNLTKNIKNSVITAAYAQQVISWGYRVPVPESPLLNVNELPHDTQLTAKIINGVDTKPKNKLEGLDVPPVEINPPVERTPTQAPKEGVAQAPKEVATQAPKEVAMQAPKEVATQAPKEVATQAPKEVPTPVQKAARRKKFKYVAEERFGYMPLPPSNKR